MTYGIGTHSFLNSTEHRQMKRERKEFTEKYERGDIKLVFTEILLCHCRSFRCPHPPSDHNKLRADYDWRTWQKRAAAGPEYWDERVS
jgi:hypothetical protein